MWNGKKKALTISMDDGILQDRRFIKLLNRYGLKATFNINSELLGNAKALWVDDRISVAHCKFRPEEVRSVYEGHELAAHTLTHPRLTTLNDEEIVRQVEKDRLRISELAGYEVVGMAYPGGGVNNDQRVADLIKAHTGIQYARTITSNDSFTPQPYLYRFQPTVYHLDFDKMMDLGHKFLELDAKTPQIFYIWGHSYEMDYSSDNWRRLEDFFQLISGHEDIFYGTNGEVLL